MTDLAITILTENYEVLSSIPDSELATLVRGLCNTDNVICFGAGRMGLSLRSFSMRLNHLGIKSSFIGDTYSEPVTKDSIFLAASGSGRTRSVLTYAQIAKEKGARVFSVVGDKDSPLAQLSDFYVNFKSCNGGLNSEDNPEKINSIQLMSTLNEQAMFLFFDIVSYYIVEQKKLSIEDIVPKHFNIE